MDFPGPDPADFAQVEALNREFLDYLAGPGRRLAGGLPSGLSAALAGTDASARARIAQCPFFLFSLGQNDNRLWSPLFAGEPRPDLVDALGRPPSVETRIVCAALAFLWPYAVHNPYAARVLSGAGNDWCERIADCALVDLIEYAGRAGRAVATAPLGQHRFLAPAAGHRSLRRRRNSASGAAWALQSILTRPTESAALRLPAAACSMPVPAMQVTDRSSVSHSTSRRYNTPPMKALSIQHLEKTYRNGNRALKGIDLEVEAGEFYALLGPNGAGKTTAIGIVTSLVNKSNGQVGFSGTTSTGNWRPRNPASASCRRK